MLGAKVHGIAYSFRRNESSTGTKVPGSEGSWNVRSRGTKVPQERKFQEANVPQNDSSTGMKVPSVDFSLPGTKVQRNEKSDIRTPHPAAITVGITHEKLNKNIENAMVCNHKNNQKMCKCSMAVQSSCILKVKSARRVERRRTAMT